MKFLQTSLFTAVVFVLPIAASAQSAFGGVGKFFASLTTFINTVLVPLIFTIAFLMFLWGVFQYFIQGGDDYSARKEGAWKITYSIIGFVIMISVWGLVNLISSGIFAETGGAAGETITLPKPPTL